jgi:iron complex outermembrane receptor protein
MRLTLMAWALCFTGLTAPAFAQTAPANTAADNAEMEAVVVTGSRIKRVIQDSPSPIQVFTPDVLERESINSPEQFISLLTANGNGLDNLASNADVVSGQARGNNGASSANLRNQGAAATLILLNGRRVAAHGLNGGVVDINQIPMAAVERIEVLKDGASAIYGTDAVGGVINFITRQNFKGLIGQGFVDVPEAGGGLIYRGSLTAGFGDLQSQGWNIMGAVSVSQSNALRGDQRSFVNTFQVDRGLSVDTRGTPFATIFPLNTIAGIAPGGTVFGPSTGTSTAPFLPGSTTVRANAGVNPLDLPGNLGCGAIDGMGPYDERLWDLPGAAFACAWDTGRAAVLQQPIQTVTYIASGSLMLGEHIVTAEVSGSHAESAKRFSNLQLTPNTTTQAYVYPRNAITAPVYDRVFNQLVAVFPTLEARRGLPMAYRWRCIECGRREIETTTKTFRANLGIDGPLGFLEDWDYKAGASYASSVSDSTLGGGYYFRDDLRDAQGNVTARGIISALNTGLINPFLLPGQELSPEALALLESTSARGTVLYGGKYSLWQVDASIAGPVFELPGGTLQVAIGVDYRREEYKFNGDQRAVQRVIIAAPFDNANALAGVSRDIKAAYAEILAPIFKGFELTLAGRIDDYDGFGTTTNPKVAFKYRPIDMVMVRGSYNTSFRVPSFNQIENGRIEATFSGRDLVDPARCPTLRVDSTIAGCEVVQPIIVNGGNPTLGPETSNQFSAGIVLEPFDGAFVAVDWWRINRKNTIQVLTLQQLIQNSTLFPDRFIRANNQLIAIDQTFINSGQTVTEGIDISAGVRGQLWDGDWNIGFDGTYLIEKKSRLVASAPFSQSEVGRFTFGGDLGLRWKHNLSLSYSRDDWQVSLSQIFRLGYRNQQLPGVASGRVNPPNDVITTKDYIVYNLSGTYNLTERFRFTAGIKNLFDTDPPFAIAYDSNTGAGSSWEPRVADPRGRSFTLLLEYKL